MTPHRDYSAELSKACGRGHPIANPQPGIGSDGRPLRPIEVGDVGYISDIHGNFIRMFNVHLAPGADGQPSADSLPDNFEPLVRRPISLIFDQTPIFKSRSVSAKGAKAGVGGPFLGGSVAFSASSEHGAILAAPDPIECYDAQHKLSYKTYAMAHIEE
ncbi:unnamed protein product [Peniophora sp. CBMAI 1063]|nr:unnamed protein product [Peniophora sp. CBMAI 1063]